jgi:putative MATE family efflux protein
VSEAPQPSPSAWETLREAVRGSEQDLTAVPIRRAVVLLAVPTVLEMSMESLLVVVDIAFVSRLGSNAVAAVGLTESMISPIYALAMGLAAGSTAIVARRTGEKDPEAASTAAMQGLFAAIACAVAIGIVGAVLAPAMLGAMGASDAVLREGAGYARVMLGGNVGIFLLFVVNAILRSAGDAAAAMRALWIANLLNMVLAPLFIFGLGPIAGLGVTGAGLATTLSRGVGVGYQLFVLAGGRSRLTLAARHVRLHLEPLKALLRIAWTATLQVLVETASWLGLMRIVSSYGSEAVAGYTIAMRIAIFAMLPSWGLANAAATLVGQNLGAGKPERAERSVTTVAKYNVSFLGLVGLTFALVPAAVVSLISREAGVAGFAADCLRIVALGFPFFGYGMVAIQAFNGAGDTRTPVLLNLACFWAFKIPLAYALATSGGLGARGVFFAVTAAYAAQALVGGALFRRGTWKATKIEVKAE